jgi:hypothetical protein
MPVFRGPTYQRKLGRRYELWWATENVGKTVVKKNGTWTTVVVPNQDYLATCQRVLRGGFEEQITTAEAAELTAAGYGDYIFDV